MRTIALVALLAAACSGGGGGGPAYSVDIHASHPFLPGTWRGTATSSSGSSGPVVLTITNDPALPDRYPAHVETAAATYAGFVRVIQGGPVVAVDFRPPLFFSGDLTGWWNPSDPRDYSLGLHGDYRTDIDTGRVDIVRDGSLGSPVVIEDTYDLGDEVLILRYEVR